MGRIRVLVVDDAVVIRKLVSEALAEDPEIEIAGVAANGRIALARLRELSPDLVTLDVEMPELDGLATLSEIRKLWPRLPVVMFSTLTERGADTTLEALARGASDYATKPSRIPDPREARQQVKDELLPRIKALCAHVLGASPTLSTTALRTRPIAPGAGVASGANATADPAPPSALPSAAAGNAPTSASIRLAAPRSGRVELLAIGCSTGGPNALTALLPALPADLGVPVLVVQHMPPMFTRLLAERLDEKCALEVCEAQAGQPILPGRVYIAPGDFHLLVARAEGQLRVALEQGPPENSCRPAVDVLFRSLAAQMGAGTLAVVLTGMGRDGLVGARRIHECGGRVLAQDEASSVVWGMPGFVAQAGVAEAVLPLDRIASEIVRRIQPARAGGGRVS